MNYAQRLQHLINERNLSQNKLSKGSGVSQGVISDVLTQKNKAPSLPTLEKLCSALGITLAEFFAENSESDPKEGKLLSLYRQLPDQQQDALIAIADTLVVESKRYESKVEEG